MVPNVTNVNHCLLGNFLGRSDNDNANEWWKIWGQFEASEVRRLQSRNTKLLNWKKCNLISAEKLLRRQLCGWFRKNVPGPKFRFSGDGIGESEWQCSTERKFRDLAETENRCLAFFRWHIFSIHHLSNLVRTKNRNSLTCLNNLIVFYWESVTWLSLSLPLFTSTTRETQLQYYQVKLLMRPNQRCRPNVAINTPAQLEPKDGILRLIVHLRSRQQREKKRT